MTALTVSIKTLFHIGMVPAFLAPAIVYAQDLQVPAEPPIPAGAEVPRPADPEEVAFSAEELTYDEESEIVTASGYVYMVRNDVRLRADQVSWNRITGEVSAIGNVAITNPDGTIYGDRVELSDSLRDGMIDNLLLVLADGGRLAARSGERADNRTTLNDAAYTPCSVIAADGCPKEPSWKISAVRVVHDPVRKRIYYDGARLSLFGASILYLPGLSHPDGSGSGGGTGLLVPDIRYGRDNGLELSAPFYIALAPNRDLTLTPIIYSDVLPALAAQYRELTSNGGYQVSGMITQSSSLTTGRNEDSLPGDSNRRLRGYIDASGRFQLDPYWTLSGSGWITTDRTFMRRYDITDRDRLRSTINAERIDDASYLSIAGWATQTLRLGASQGQQPIALPLINYLHRLPDPLLGGQVEFQANTLALTRTAGQDTQRAFAGARWDLRELTRAGQEVTFTLYGRGDVYHSSHNDLTPTVVYRGRAGWETRAIAAAAVDVRWPFVGPLLGGTQRLSPRVQLVANPRVANNRIPNEDSRSFDLEYSNLFALNRFSGYDRWDDTTRVTYGMEWSFERPNLQLDSVIAQSYRISERNVTLPDGTGLSGRFSDIVGRNVIRYKELLSFTHRYRLDKDSLAIRRNELNATIGSYRTYVEVSYLTLNRNIESGIEDLSDREEIQLGARVQVARYWSIFGAAVVDLTDGKEDPASLFDGFEPVGHRLGINYEDECLEIGIAWRRNYEAIGDNRKGNSFLFRLALKNLGR